MALKLNSVGGGVVTIDTPNTSNNYTLTAPTTTGTVMVSPQTLTVPNTAGTVMVSGNMPAFSVYRNTNQSVTTSTWTKVALDTKDFDTAGAFDNTTNYRFQPTVVGYYQLQGGVTFGGTPNTQTQATCAIYKNGTQNKQGSYWASNSVTTAQMTQVISSVIYLNGTTDYVELWGYNIQTSPTFNSGISQTYFNGYLVRAA